MIYLDFSQFLLILIFDPFLHRFHEFLHFEGKLLDLFFEPTHLLNLFQVVNPHNLLAKAIYQVHFRVLLLFLLLVLLLLFVLFYLQLLQELSLIFSSELLIEIPDLLSSFLVNKDIIQVSQIGQMGN